MKENGEEFAPVKIKVNSLNVYYGKYHALHDININIPKNKVTAFIGPSGCGKSTLLKTLNLMNLLVEDCKVSGSIFIDKKNILESGTDEVKLRTKVGMVFQKPNPFPMSIYDNIAYAPRLHGMVKKRSSEEEEVVINSLTQAGLYKEVENNLFKSAFELSGGQQQRLCIARTIAIRPDIILMDEPCSALDPIGTAKIERLIDDLRDKYTIVIVTHSMKQAARISQYTGFFYSGKLIEQGSTEQIFTNPQEQQTEDYITGRFG